ncbi:MAG TPA: gluconate 2-dehydrogenase subunit 3 family protein [Gemmatimonadaceae bacterium]
MSETKELIDRRDAIKRVSILLGGVALVGGSSLWSTACRTEREAAYKGVGKFSPDDVALLDEVADTILPPTKTPGAKAAKTGPFMALMVTDCYEPKDQQVFMDGMKQLDAATQKSAGTTFMKATPDQRLAVLQALDKEQHDYMKDKKDREAPAHYFRMMKELSLLGYFTSEIGMTQAQRYAEAPGRYDPCVDYKPGDRAWANHA